MVLRETRRAIDVLMLDREVLGLEPGRVRVIDSDSGWAEAFERLRAVIAAQLDDVAVEHVGSTSVPGLAAKPLLDVALGMGQDVSADDLIERLRPVGFDFVDDLGPFGGLFFVATGPDGRVLVHVHAVDRDDPQWHRYLAFRDHLRANPEVAADYAALKVRLAEEYVDDREGYTAAKFDFVAGVVADLD